MVAAPPSPSLPPPPPRLYQFVGSGWRWRVTRTAYQDLIPHHHAVLTTSSPQWLKRSGWMWERGEKTSLKKNRRRKRLICFVEGTDVEVSPKRVKENRQQACPPWWFAILSGQRKFLRVSDARVFHLPLQGSRWLADSRKCCFLPQTLNGDMLLTAWLTLALQYSKSIGRRVEGISVAVKTFARSPVHVY